MTTFFFDVASFNYVIICHTTVATLNVLSSEVRQYLVAAYSRALSSGLPEEVCFGYCYCCWDDFECWIPRSAVAKGVVGVVSLEDVLFVSSLCLSPQ